MVQLGNKVRDRVSGFEGIAVSRHSYLFGCDRITVQSQTKKDSENRPLDCAFDELQLEVLENTTSADFGTQQVAAAAAKGGPRKAPKAKATPGRR